MEIILDGALMTDRVALHDLLAEKFAFPDYYGRNLDALYDLLSAYPQQISVTLIHANLLEAHLGRYGKSVIQTLNDASRDNVRLTISIFDENN